jgi:catechol 2,3-dioxygenase-like lactoylglutathione lyase family enzyme
MPFELPALVPELDVSDLEASLKVYIDIFGFGIHAQRPEERFAYLIREGAHLMLEEAAGPGRRFRTAPLARPYGRGINLQIGVSDIDTIHRAVRHAQMEILIALEERWYRHDDIEHGNRQFVVADPDGYLLRFAQNLGKRPARSDPRDA